jgi:hypothetical protein
VQLHHIDQKNDNNDEANLAAVCLRCHDEAHTHHSLSQNLTPTRLRDAKRRWEVQVSEALAQGMLPETLQQIAIWTYVNHDRLPSVLKTHGISYDQGELKELIQAGIVNRLGIPLPVIQPANRPDELVTLYDRIPYEYRVCLMELYSVAIGKLIQKARPIDFRQLTAADQVQAIVQQGTLCFVLRGFRFRSEPPRLDRSQIRHVKTTVADIAIKFLVDTRFMFGTSAVTESFIGHRQAAALLHAKSIGQEGEQRILHCTPLAMGTGFLNRRKPWPGPPDDPAQEPG